MTVLRRFWGLCALLVLFLLLPIYADAGKPQTLKNSAVVVDGLEREYYLYTPHNRASMENLPVVMVFHGGGGNAKKMSRYSGFRKLAEKYNFIAVFPQGFKGQWYEERMLSVVDKPDSRIDDVKFVRELLKKLDRDYSIDRKRIFAVGISNGGVFSQQLAVKASREIKAIATIASQLPESLTFNPDTPVSVLMINGTNDPLMPYTGGDVVITLSPGKRQQGRIKTRGRVRSTDQTINLWLEQDGLSTVRPVESIIDTVADDGTWIKKSTWQQPGNRFRVELYKVIGGGHGWPGRKSFLPEKILGKISQDIDASEEIWNFFSSLK